MNYYLGIDLGTGSMKTVLFDVDGLEIAQNSLEYPIYQLHNGWSEQDPEDWYDACVKTVNYVMDKSKVNPKDVVGLGISGQMAGAVFLDKEGRTLRKAILWNDGRTTESCAHFNEIVGEDLLLKHVCNPARPGLQAAKVQWVIDNEPDLFKNVAHIMLPKDYLRYRLTGEFATEVSDAGSTQVLNVPERKWSDEILDKMGLDQSLYGKVYESSDITGYILEDVAKELGITSKCAVVGGAGDNEAAGVGTGIVVPGRMMTTIGTSGTVFACIEKPILDPDRAVYTYCMAVPGVWHFMGSVNSAGDSLKW